MIKSEFINANHFTEICDFITDNDRRYVDKKIADKNCVIFCKTDWILQLFNVISQFPNRKYIVVVGMSDCSYNDNINNIKPNNIIKIFTTMNFVNKPDIISIPLGVENFYGGCKGGSIDVEKLLEESNNIIQNKELRVHLNCNVGNNISERNICYFNVKKSRYCFEQNRTTFGEYLHEVNKSFFVAAPFGNGNADTHRLWESFYMKSFPIVRRHNTYKDCLDLPFVFIDSWEEVNDSFLEKKYEEFKNKNWNYEKIQMSYWANLINNFKKDLE